MFTVINFIISISKTFLSHVQDYADELLTPLTILDESGTALPNAQEQFKVMLKGPSSLKSYLGLPFNVLQVSRRALIAYSPNQFPWNLLYLQFKVMLKGPGSLKSYLGLRRAIWCVIIRWVVVSSDNRNYCLDLHQDIYICSN